MNPGQAENQIGAARALNTLDVCTVCQHKRSFHSLTNNTGQYQAWLFCSACSTILKGFHLPSWESAKAQEEQP